MNLQLDLGLTVSSGGEDLGLLGGNGGVPVDQLGEHPAQGLNTQGEGSHVKKENVGDVSSQYSALDGGSHGHSLVRVDRLAGVAAKDFLASFLDLGHSRHSSNQDNFTNI